MSEPPKAPERCVWWWLGEMDETVAIPIQDAFDKLSKQVQYLARAHSNLKQAIKNQGGKVCEGHPIMEECEACRRNPK